MLFRSRRELDGCLVGDERGEADSVHYLQVLIESMLDASALCNSAHCPVPTPRRHRVVELAVLAPMRLEWGLNISHRPRCLARSR